MKKESCCQLATWLHKRRALQRQPGIVPTPARFPLASSATKREQQASSFHYFQAQQCWTLGYFKGARQRGGKEVYTVKDSLIKFWNGIKMKDREEKYFSPMLVCLSWILELGSPSADRSWSTPVCTAAHSTVFQHFSSFQKSWNHAKNST